MSDWSAGYVSELGYTYGYYEELNTNRVDLCLLNKGFQPPTVTHALELGFGQGVSVNIHAAASDIEWTGTDFNPSQANFARQLAGQSGAKATLYDIADDISYKSRRNYTLNHLIERIKIYNEENFNYDIINVPIKD